MSNFETNYQPLAAYNDNGEDTAQDGGVMIHVVPESSKARWNHIDDLDSFFTRVYHYHQKHGFTCMMLQEGLELVQFAFVVIFSTFLLVGVDYSVLFRDKLPYGVPIANATYNKVTMGDALIPIEVAMASLNGVEIVCLIVTSIFWVLRVFKVVYHFFQFVEIKNFYLTALKIATQELDNMTWYEVQRKMQEIQSEQQMCIHKAELTELDIYHRILRFKNYMVAMVNKSLLPIKFSVPFLGEMVYFTKGLKYNFELILFNGPWAPFENSWHLKEDYKKFGKRKELADELSKHIMWIGLTNLMLCPLIFLWQILYFFFNYAELIKREPGSLGARRWSIYGRHYLRHFNELEHELNARLNRAHRLSTSYMNIFSSHILAIIAKNVAFFTGSMLAVLLILTFWDEDVLQVEHVLTTMTVLGMVVALCRVFIPDEHLIFCPERLMTSILSHIHYMPDHWKGNAHTTQVRDEFTQLFQYKAVHLLEELMSPLITPFILLFRMRHRSLDMVDFYRNFTVDVVGVGDVCSFAQMDLKKHGNPMWMPDNISEANDYVQAENGKTELSLLHFTMTNPEFQLPQDANLFMAQMRERAVRDLELMQTLKEENPLYYSLNSVNSLGAGYSHLIGSLPRPMFSAAFQGQDNQRSATTSSFQPNSNRANPVLRGGISRTEGPGYGSSTGLLSSVQQAMSQSTAGTSSMMDSFSQQQQQQQHHHMGTADRDAEYGAGRPYETNSVEMSTADMSFSALYMHELHHRRRFFKGATEETPSTSTRGGYNLWQRPAAAEASAAAMPCIQESPLEATDDRAEKMPLLESKFSRSS